MKGGDGMRSMVARFGTYGAGLVVAMVTFGVGLSAAVPVSVPEIDGSSVAAGLGALAAGVLVVRARFGNK
jgi:hypothetical protein